MNNPYKLTLPIKVTDYGKYEIIYKDKKIVKEARIICVDAENASCPVIALAKGKGNDKEYIYNLGIDGIVNYGESGAFLREKADPRDDLIPGQAIWVRDHEDEDWTLHIFVEKVKPGEGVIAKDLRPLSWKL